MRLLTEIIDRVEVDRVKFLLESNGIPVFIGNEESARNFGFIYPARRFGIWVYDESQFDCALALLTDESYIVKHPIDVKDYYKRLKENQPEAFSFILKKLIIPGAIFSVLVFVGVILLILHNKR